MLKVQALHKQFGSTRVIQGVDLQIEDRERHALIGPNGAGKSTLFNLMSCRMAPTSGRVEVLGRDVTGWTPHKLARAGLGRSFQVSNAFQGLSVRDNLEVAVMWRSGIGCGFGLPSRSARLRERLEFLLHESGLADKARALAGELAYADQRSLEIAMTLGGDPSVVLLDEPTAGMSKAETERAIGLIRRLTEGRTLVIVEHDMNVVFKLADRISVLVRGEIVITDKPDVIRSSPIVREAYLGAKGVQHAGDP